MPAMWKHTSIKLIELLKRVLPLKIMKNSTAPKSANKKQYRVNKLFAYLNSKEFIFVPGLKEENRN